MVGPAIRISGSHEVAAASAPDRAKAAKVYVDFVGSFYGSSQIIEY